MALRRRVMFFLVFAILWGAWGDLSGAAQDDVPQSPEEISPDDLEVIRNLDFLEDLPMLEEEPQFLEDYEGIVRMEEK